MPVERDSFQRHPVKAAGKFLTVLILGSALLVAGFIGLKYKKVASTDKKVTDTSESRKDLDQLYGGNDPVKSEVSRLETVKSDLTKLQFTLANKWTSKKGQDKKLGTELIVATSPDGLKNVTFNLGYPQVGGACADVNSKDFEILDIEPISPENATAVDSKLYYIAGLQSPALNQTKFSLSAGIINERSYASIVDKKAGDKISCAGGLYNLFATKYLSPRDIVTLGEYFSVLAGNGISQGSGYEFTTEADAKSYFAGEEYQQVKQILTSVQVNL
jgi:hypothetical protein